MDNILLKHCPFCGHLPNPDNYRDSIHAVVRDDTVWKAGCLLTEGGCDASVLGWTRDEAIKNWNRRVTTKEDGGYSLREHPVLLGEVYMGMQEKL